VKYLSLRSAVQAFVLLLLAGCAHVAKHYDAPSFTAMEASPAKAVEAVSEAGATEEKQRVSIAAQSTTITALRDQAAALFKAAPPELREAVAALQTKIEDAANENLDLRDANDQLRTQVAAAEAALAQHTKDMALVEANAEKITASANAAELGWQHDSQVATKLIENSIWFKLGAVVLLLLTGLFFFLKFTGRLATVGAQIASKIP
jgi:hypothetical protein